MNSDENDNMICRCKKQDEFNMCLVCELCMVRLLHGCKAASKLFEVLLTPSIHLVVFADAAILKLLRRNWSWFNIYFHTEYDPLGDCGTAAGTDATGHFEMAITSYAHGRRDSGLASDGPLARLFTKISLRPAWTSSRQPWIISALGWPRAINDLHTKLRVRVVIANGLRFMSWNCASRYVRRFLMT